MDKYPEDLPTDILSIIFGLLDSKWSFRALALTCKAFHASVLPFLYHDIHLRPDDVYRPKPTGLDDSRYQASGSPNGARNRWYEPLQTLVSPGSLPSHHRHLRGLALTLHRRPEYAKFVREISVRYNIGRRLARRVPFQPTSVPSELCRAIEAWSVDSVEAQEWLNAAADGSDDDCYLALLLPLLTNITKLDLEFPVGTHRTNDVLSRAFRGMFPMNKTPVFPALADITYVHGDDTRFRYFMPPYPSAACLTLPSISCVRALRIGHYHEQADDLHELAALPSASSNVTYIELRETCLSWKDVGYFLRLPKALRTFIYESLSPLHTGSLLANLETTLEPQKAALENMSLNLSMDLTPFGIQNLQLLPYLASFPNLKRLNISSSLVCISPSGARIRQYTTQPAIASLASQGRVFAQLRELSILDVQSAEMRSVLELVGYVVDASASLAPSLKKINIQAAYLNGGSPMFDGVEEILRSAEERNIILAFVSNDPARLRRKDDFSVGVQRWGMDADLEGALICYPTSAEFDKLHLPRGF